MAKNWVDVHKVVTDKIVGLLEKGVRPWTRPWDIKGGSGLMGFGSLPLRYNGIPYQGINVWMLWAEAADKGYMNPRWMTFKQAARFNGASVRKGEKGTMIVKYTTIDKRDPKTKKVIKDSSGRAEKIPVPSYSYVFNIEQIDGLPERFYIKDEPVKVVETAQAKIARIDAADKYFTALGGVVKHGGSRAFYSTKADFIQMPNFEDFHDAESYYATLAHEYTHWTGHETRTKRTFGERFGDDAYAVEELVAEMGSAFQCALLGLTLEPREDHAAYLASWLKVLKADKYAIIKASSEAQKAVDFLNALVGVEKPVGEQEIAEEMKPEIKKAA